MSDHEHPHRPFGELKLPELPSSRISEGSLRGWEASPDPRLVAAASEVRRYRALMAGLAASYCCTCVFCENSKPGTHGEDCPWPAVEAEAKATREERPST